ncbi:MAG: glycosyltransferase [Actinobacteria bacterium]|nr:glycosyltransferase [Actinomycetota bacterium]MCB8996975.1 glycosyltransferase [Actinomycetota bacterium]MCB9414034.1 glycosyltransferase [Actinomycetota bacterium]MCB9424543.1 glycosyltransferase [Actinomycetota bacterium]HRY08613.1 glycosyltransferase [Candidatus Nanopelagicales bacterium]
MPEFSVIMPTYNFARYLEEAVGSVLAQTDPDWELIVVDDGSTDDTWAVLSAIDHPQITAIRHDHNQGISGAFNTGLAAATGTWICNLDSDDRYLPTFLQRQREFLRAHPDVDVTATWVREIGADGSPVSGTYEAWFNRHRDLNDPEVWIYQNPVCHNATAVRHSLHEELGGEHPQMRSSVDWEKWVRMLAAGARFGVIPEVLVESRVHGANMSHDPPAVRFQDWAIMTRDTLTGWLQRIGRDDLVARNLAHFLLEPRIADMELSELTELLGTATGLPPASLAGIAPGLRLAAVSQRDHSEEIAATLSAYAAHVQSLLADYSVLESELSSSRAQLAETRSQLATVLDSRSYRWGQKLRRVLP